MADTQLNMRVSDEVAERFRTFCKEQGISQPQGMDSLLSMIELVQAKEAMPNRQTEIEGFEMHVKAVMDAFVNSLAINADAEERAKAQFITALESKDKTIHNLQEKVEDLKNLLAEAQKTEQVSKDRLAASEAAAAATTTAAEKAVATAEAAAVAAQRSADDKAAIVEMLTTKLKEAESKLGGYDTLKSEAQEAQNQIMQLRGQLKEAEFTHKASIMEIEYKAAQEMAAAQEKAAREREQLERNRSELERSHSAEIKALYEKMSAYQDQIAVLTKAQKSDNQENEKSDL